MHKLQSTRQGDGSILSRTSFSSKKVRVRSPSLALPLRGPWQKKRSVGSFTKINQRTQEKAFAQERNQRQNKSTRRDISTENRTQAQGLEASTLASMPLLFTPQIKICTEKCVFKRLSSVKNTRATRIKSVLW